MADTTNNTGQPGQAQAHVPAGAAPSSPSSASRELPQPYVRFWARLIDKALYLATLPLLAAVVGTGFFFYVCFLFWLAGYVAVEALLLATVGTTPGKAILGVFVTTADGKKLSFNQAWRRASSVYVRGRGLGAVMQWMGYRDLKTDGRTSWDESGNFLVKYKRLSAGRMLAGVAAPLVATLVLFGSAGMRGPKSAHAGGEGPQGSGTAATQPSGAKAPTGSISVTPVKPAAAPAAKPSVTSTGAKPAATPGKAGGFGGKPRAGTNAPVRPSSKSAPKSTTRPTR